MTRTNAALCCRIYVRVLCQILETVPLSPVPVGGPPGTPPPAPAAARPPPRSSAPSRASQRASAPATGPGMPAVEAWGSVALVSRVHASEVTWRGGWPECVHVICCWMSGMDQLSLALHDVKCCQTVCAPALSARRGSPPLPTGRRVRPPPHVGPHPLLASTCPEKRHMSWLSPRPALQSTFWLRRSNPWAGTRMQPGNRGPKEVEGT